MKLRIVATLVLILAVIAPAAAQEGGVVREIVIEGAQRIEQSSVRSYLVIQEGDPFDAHRIDESLKSLFATGLFADVSIDRQGDRLIVKVVENPVINRIAFEGNKRVKDEDLQQEIQLRPRIVFTRTKVQSDVKRILDIYRAHGRFAATVSPKVIRLDQNRVDLVFEIEEGELTTVKNIRFVGNKVMDDGDLRSIIRTKETAWYRFFSSDDNYDPDRLTFDRELLRRAYLADGYADFRVRSAIAELTPERDAFYITFTVDEGQRYKFGKVGINTSLRDLDPEALRQYLDFSEGDWFDNSKVETVVNDLTDEVGKLGYAFVEVRPRIDRDRKNRIINLAFEINEGPRVFVERIDITGNVRTIDKVIRRKMLLVEGDAFNSAKLRRSRKRIKDLGYFAKVDLQQIPGSAPDKAIVTVNVEEQSTGSFSIGVGYSTDLGPLADMSIRERNLLGHGQDLKLGLSLAAQRSQIDLSFTEPYFLDRELSAGVDLFRRSRDLSDTQSYTFTETGGGVRFGYPLAENLNQNLRYQFKVSDIGDVRSSASSLIKQQEGTRYVSEVSQALMYDRRDSATKPTDGYYLRLSNNLAGVGGTVHYLRNQLFAGYYYPFAPEWTLGLSGRVGDIIGLGEDVEIPDRFFLGGSTLRGFQSAGVGPRDSKTGDSLGGEWVYNGSAQLEMPVGLPNELGISGHVFSDFGSVGTVSPASSTVVDAQSLRMSVGAGLAWQSPFGPMAVDFGIPLLDEPEDKSELIRVNFGTRF